MSIKLKVVIQTLQKSHDRHKISFTFEFNNKTIKKVFGANLPPPPIQLSLIVIIPNEVTSPISGKATDSSYICCWKEAHVVQFLPPTIMTFLGHTTTVLVM